MQGIYSLVIAADTQYLCNVREGLDFEVLCSWILFFYMQQVGSHIDRKFSFCYRAMLSMFFKYQLIALFIYLIKHTLKYVRLIH